MEKVCQDHGVLFIADEVMCGLGRTGAMHAYKRHGVKPDILLLGKALAGGYAPLSAMLIGDKIEEVFLTGSGTGAFNHGHTNQNHAGSCATALAVQEIVIKDKLIERVHAKASAFEGMLCSRLEDHPNVGDIRGEGYFWTVSACSI
jgi:adenosylmethionine-8-amino-7-oxononanoate aminotransferase